MWAAIIPFIVLLAIIIGVVDEKVEHKPDTIVQEVAEDVIYITTGREIDFSKHKYCEKVPNPTE